MNNQLGDISKFSERESVYDYKVIKLELSSKCNARCVFCTMFQSKLKPRDFLTIENAQKFISLNKEMLKEEKFFIEPFFNGESLLNPFFGKIMELFIENNILIGDLDTNFGLELDISRFAAIPWRSVTVNIGGLSPEIHKKVMGTTYETVISNLRKLLNSPERKFPVYLKMNPVADNLHEQQLLSRFTLNISPELKWKSQQTGIPVPFDLTGKQLSETIKRIYSAKDEQFFRFIPSGESIKEKNKRCIYKLPCINADGRVTICAHDQLRHLDCGNAFITPLKQIFTSAIYKKNLEMADQRKHLFCKGCN